ncbi:putative diphthamide synthesis protein-domain-containing protein [Lineolata rhizophorae]|uniref:2-(3-amino-3-carboxypropyl)histidine synthase subunit 1 n=1 Tax=Lineolata rhizophorae TaxID=578093 RepID=A0A6A6P900_9PEZI|nr:putative diphthamide synthesis protein-domain-containing protein [Lineolata rhizophorae]
MEEDRASTNLGADDGNQVMPAPTAASRQPRRRFVGKRCAAPTGGTPQTNDETAGAVRVAPRSRPARALNSVPAEILEDPDINDAIGLLPRHYSFEIHKTIHRIRTSGATKIALQFPEGLLLFATTVSDILTKFCPGIETLIMGDVTYGACCIDDYTARALGCDLLVHYAHSCLIPVDVTKIRTLYVFVDISIDVQHIIATVSRNFTPGKTIVMVGTIQFNATIHGIAPALRNAGYNVIIPQSAPLSKGEILGCTSPRLADDQQIDLLLYLGDGRFHLESAMIHNPSIPAYRYDPYSRRLTRESYDHDELYNLRSSAISSATSAKKWGLILGALGRQGNPHTLALIERTLTDRGIPSINLLLSEIFPGKLAMMQDVDCWVQIACPRLSIDWGYAFPRPLLSPYEALVALGVKEANWLINEPSKDAKLLASQSDIVYPMDFYAKNGLGRTRKDGLVR